MKEHNADNNRSDCADSGPYGIDRTIGSRSATLANRNMLSESAARKPTHHHTCSCPVAVLVLPRQNMKHTSISPAKIRIIQFIGDCIFSYPNRGLQAIGKILGVTFLSFCKTRKNYVISGIDVLFISGKITDNCSIFSNFVFGNL